MGGDEHGKSGSSYLAGYTRKNCTLKQMMIMMMMPRMMTRMMTLMINDNEDVDNDFDKFSYLE